MSTLTIRIPPRTVEEINDERNDIIQAFMRDNDMCTRHQTNAIYGLLKMPGYSFETGANSFNKLTIVEQTLIVQCIRMIYERDE